MTGVNSGIAKEHKRGDNRVASVSAGQNLVGRLGRALDDGDLPMEKNNIWDARTGRSIAEPTPAGPLAACSHHRSTEVVRIPCLYPGANHLGQGVCHSPFHTPHTNPLYRTDLAKANSILRMPKVATKR